MLASHNPRRRDKTTEVIFSKSAKTLLLFSVVILCVIPGLLFSRLYVTDGFLYQIIAYVRLTLPLDHLELFVKGGYSFRFVEFLPGYPMILSLFCRLSAISPEQLNFMPIAGIFIPLCYFALARKLFKSLTLSILLALYGAYDIGLASHYNIFAYTWSNLLYLGFLLISLRLMEHKRFSDIIILFILFGGSLFLHYASTMWLIVFVFSLNLLFYLRSRLSKSDTNDKSVGGSLAMPLVFMVSFLAFNQIFYRVWLPSFQEATEGNASSLGLFTEKIMSYLGQGTTTPEKYQFLNPWGQSFGWWRTIEYLLILIPIGLWFLRMAINLGLRHPISIKRPYYLELTVTMVITVLADWFVYGSHSGINMRYISLALPFLTVIALDQLDVRDWFREIVIGILTVTAVVAYAIALQYYSRFPPTSYGQVQASSNWFLNHQTQGISLSDLDTSGLYLVAGSSSDSNFPHFIVYDSNLYTSVADPENATNPDVNYSFVVVDSATLTKPLHGISNRLYEPLSLHLDAIKANSYLSRVYDDGSVWILLRFPRNTE